MSKISTSDFNSVSQNGASFYMILWKAIPKHRTYRYTSYPWGTTVSRDYGMSQNTTSLNIPYRQQSLCHAITTISFLGIHCPLRTTLSTFTESVWTEIVWYKHIAKIATWSHSHNRKSVKPTSEMILEFQKTFLTTFEFATTTIKVTNVYHASFSFKGLSWNAIAHNPLHQFCRGH